MNAAHDLCLQCGAILSQYRDAGEMLCAPCQHVAAEHVPDLRALKPEELADALAGILLLARALTPGEHVYLRDKLCALGVEADHADIINTVRKLERRHGMRVDCAPPQAGHRLDHWPPLGFLVRACQRLTRETP